MYLKMLPKLTTTLLNECSDYSLSYQLTKNYENGVDQLTQSTHDRVMIKPVNRIVMTNLACKNLEEAF
jgi:hypothetical protein